MRMLCQAMMALLALSAIGQRDTTLPRQIGAWKTEAAPLVYQGSQLYTFIDGGADIYLEYDFEQLESQIYRRGEDEITVELSRMGNGAYGMFTFLRPRDAEKAAAGDAAFLSGYYLVFVKGPFLCALTAQGELTGRNEALLELAASIASRLDGAARPPDVLRLLPTAERVNSSEKQIRGPIGLRNASSTAAELLTGFTDGAVAGYHSDCLAGLLVWNDTAAADQAWRRAAKQNDSDGANAAKVFRQPDGAGFFAAERTGAAYVIFASGPDKRRVEELLETVRSAAAGAVPDSR